MIKNQKRILSLVLCLLISAVMFAGCTGKTTTESSGKDTSKETAKKEALSLKYFHYWENKNHINEDEDIVGPVIKEMFGITFDEIINPTKDPESRFNLMISSGDISDVMVLPFSLLSQVKQYGKDGLFYKLNDEIGKYPNLKGLYSPYIERLLSDDSGTIVSIAIDAWEGRKDANYNKEGMWIQKSILEKLEINQEDIKTPEDLLDLLRRIRDEIKVARNGKSIVPYALGPEGWGDSKFFLMYGADWHNLMTDDKSITFLPTHPGAKEGIRTLYIMMQEGLIEKDSFIQKDVEWRQKLAQGRFAIIMHAPTIVYNDLNNVFQSGLPEGVEDTYVPISFPYAEQTHKYFQYPDNPGSITVLSSEIKHPERVLEMIDWTASDDAYLLLSSGTEGKFYTMKDGKAELTEEGKKIYVDGKKQESYGLRGWYRFAGFGDTWKELGGLAADDIKIKETSDIFAAYKQKDDGTSLFPNPDKVVAPNVEFRNEGWGIFFKIWKDAQMQALYSESEEKAMEIWDMAIKTMQEQAGERMSKEFEEEYQRQLVILKNDKVSQEAAKAAAAATK